MGWTCYITTDKSIKDEDLDTIVASAPKHLAGAVASKQSWGWSSGVDVIKPSMRDNYSLRLSGSYGCSGDIAKEYAKWITEELIKIGHVIKSTKFNW